mmetsp:Transcript_46161/g.75320  ORF Transcript_46161/g.75320 Transcript_46161/m.75320 type:complete len:257 (-) Transcript_46161:743-1513(-)
MNPERRWSPLTARRLLCFHFALFNGSSKILHMETSITALIDLLLHFQPEVVAQIFDQLQHSLELGNVVVWIVQIRLWCHALGLLLIHSSPDQTRQHHSCCGAPAAHLAIEDKSSVGLHVLQESAGLVYHTVVRRLFIQNGVTDVIQGIAILLKGVVNLSKGLDCLRRHVLPGCNIGHVLVLVVHEEDALLSLGPLQHIYSQPLLHLFKVIHRYTWIFDVVIQVALLAGRVWLVVDEADGLVSHVEPEDSRMLALPV